MKHIGNLIITAENQADYAELTTISGNLCVSGSARADLPALTSISGETFAARNFKMLMILDWVAAATPKYLRIGCQRRTWEEWEASGRTAPPDRAHERVRAILESHVPLPLSDGIPAELDGIVAAYEVRAGVR